MAAFQNKTQTILDFLAAFNAELRIRIFLSVAASGEKTVVGLCEELGRPQALVSHHILPLYLGGFLTRRPEGRFNYYSITKKGEAALAIMETIKKFE